MMNIHPESQRRSDERGSGCGSQCEGLGRLTTARLHVCIRIVGSGVFLLPLPTVCVTFGEDVAVGRGPG